jgi:hypothetical protein
MCKARGAGVAALAFQVARFGGADGKKTWRAAAVERFEFLLSLDIAALNDDILDHDIGQFSIVGWRDGVWAGENAFRSGDDGLTGGITVLAFTGRILVIFEIGLISVLGYFQCFVDRELSNGRFRGQGLPMIPKVINPHFH